MNKVILVFYSSVKERKNNRIINKNIFTFVELKVMPSAYVWPNTSTVHHAMVCSPHTTLVLLTVRKFALHFGGKK